MSNLEGLRDVWLKKGDIDIESAKKFSQHTGWKELLLQQFTTRYMIMIVLVTLAHVMIAKTNALFALVASYNNKEVKELPLIAHAVISDVIYLIDVLIRFFYFRAHWPTMKQFNEPASLELMILDILTLLPYETLYQVIAQQQIQQVVVCCLRLRVCPRMLRVLNIMLNIRHHFEIWGVKMTYFTMLLAMMSASEIIDIIAYSYCCTKGVYDCDSIDYSIYFRIKYGSLEFIVITARNFEYSAVFMTFFYLLVNVMFMLFHFCTVALAASQRVIKMKSSYTFANNFTQVLNFYEEGFKDFYTKEERSMMLKHVKDYYVNVIQHRSGVWREIVLTMHISEAIADNIKLDASFSALKHSHIFRNCQLSLLKYVSTMVRFDFAIPGQVVVRKGEPMNEMIYIRHGILQLVSDEDEETEILNLSGGSVIGEMNLFMILPAPCTVVCKSFTEMVRLPTKRFRNMMVDYQMTYNYLLNSAWKRIKCAKGLRQFKLMNKVNASPVIEEIEQFHSWVHSHPVSGEIMQMQMAESLDFYVGYMDLLVLSSYIELVNDLVFLKSSWHFILQPQSPLLFWWSIILALNTLGFVLFYPWLLLQLDMDTGTLIYCYVTCCLNIIDVYLQCFTAVKDRGQTHKTVMKILTLRVQNVYFAFDVLASIPVELMQQVTSGQISNNVFGVLLGLRIMTWYRINHLFNTCIFSIFSDFLLTVIKYTFHLLLAIYYLNMYLYTTECCDDLFLKETKATNTAMEMAAMYCFTLSMILGHTSMTKRISDLNYFYMFGPIAVAAYIYYVHFMCTLIEKCGPILIKENYIRENIENVVKTIKNYELKMDVQTEVTSYLTKLWHLRVKLEKVPILVDLPKQLEISYQDIIYKNLFESNQMFKHFPIEFLRQLYEVVYRSTILNNQVIYCEGDTPDEFIIVEKGSCKITIGNGDYMVCYENYNIAVFEAHLKVPVPYTVKTTSDCILLSVDYKRFRCLLRYYPWIENIFDYYSHLYWYSEFYEKSKFYSAKGTMRRRRFDKKAKKRNKAMFISTHGKMLLYWDIFRCVCIYVNAVINTTVLENFRETDPFLYCFDAVSVLDMILRFFISYYNNLGIEVTSLDKTATHYLTHAFLVDLLGTFPFELLIQSKCTKFNRLLLFYRIDHCCRYHTDRIRNVTMFYYVGVVLALFIVINALAYIMTVQYCDFGESIYVDIDDLSQFCTKSWITETVSKPYSLQLVYQFSMLFIVTSLCRVDFYLFESVDFSTLVFVSVVSLVGYLLELTLSAKVISTHIFISDELVKFQEDMKEMVRYISMCRIDKRLKHELIKHYEYIWQKRQGDVITEVLHRTPTAFRRELLYTIFGESMQQLSILKFANTDFIKKVLLIASQQSILKTGIVYQVNDVHGLIFYLVKGSIEVLGPDYSKLTTLRAGSLFGCLDDCPMSRQTLTMVAKGHIELLRFDSVTFHNILRGYLEFSRTYAHYISFNTDYIVEIKKEQTERNNKSLKPNKKIKVFSNNCYLKTYEILVLVFAFFYLVPLEFLAQAFTLTPIIYIQLYLGDLIWLSRVLLKCNTAFEDEYGMFVYDRRAILRKYMKEWEFYFDVVTCCPLEIVAFFFRTYKQYPVLYSALRVNKLFRIFYLLHLVHKLKRKLNINVFQVSILYYVLILFAYFEMQYGFLYLIATSWERDESVPNYKTFARVIEYFRTILCMFGRISTNTIPQDMVYRNFAPLYIVLITMVNVGFLALMYSLFFFTINVVMRKNNEQKKNYNHVLNLLRILNVSQAYINFIGKFANLEEKRGISFPLFLQQAPCYLQEAILNSMFGFHLNNHQIFKHLHVDFVRQLAATMRTVTFVENTYVCLQGEINETMYFIHEGMVHALSEDSLFTETVEHILVHGDSFGVRQLLIPNMTHSYNYLAKCNSVLVRLKRKDFIRLMNFFPSVKKYLDDVQNFENIIV